MRGEGSRSTMSTESRGPSFYHATIPRDRLGCISSPRTEVPTSINRCPEATAWAWWILCDDGRKNIVLLHSYGLTLHEGERRLGQFANVNGTAGITLFDKKGAILFSKP